MPLQGIVVFDIDGEKWTLDLTPGSRGVKKGAPEGKPDLTLTISDENFVKLVMGKMGPQQVNSGNKNSTNSSTCKHKQLLHCIVDSAPNAAMWSFYFFHWCVSLAVVILRDLKGALMQAFLMRKLKIGGSMALALKLQPILDAAAPRAKL